MNSTADIQVPSKYDIIPLHTSDRATFKDCRRKWYWSSPAQSNLVPKATIHGIYMPFLFGTAIHHALEMFYNPVLKEDPEIAFGAYWDLQWNGGEVKESELSQFADRSPQYNQAKDTWTVKGLEDILPSPNIEEWNLHQDLGLGMMRFYKEYAEREDDFTVISSEHTFSVPVIDPTTGEPLYMIDTRPMPDKWEPNFNEGNVYGPLMREVAGDDFDPVFMNYYIEKQVHARGRQDLIVQGNNTGNYAIMDHKTTTAQLNDEYFVHTDLDEQCTTYIWTAEVEAKMHDLPYTEIAGIVYQALRKAYPMAPSITTRGVPSLDKSKESTTAALFEKTIKDLGIETLFHSDDKMQAYFTYLTEVGDKQFIMRRDVKRNEHQKQNAGLRIYMEALDMLDSPRIYPNPTKNWSCLKCTFRAPCLAVEAGYDYESMIEDGYESNHDR